MQEVLIYFLTLSYLLAGISRLPSTFIRWVTYLRFIIKTCTLDLKSFRMLEVKTDLKTPELETRLIEFAVMNLKIARKLRRAFDQKSLSRRLIRASASAALTYGDLPYAGSSLDFITTMNSVLKELREACAFLNMIRRQKFMESGRVDFVYQEGKQLIVLFMRNLEELDQ